MRAPALVTSLALLLAASLLIASVEVRRFFFQSASVLVSRRAVRALLPGKASMGLRLIIAVVFRDGEEGRKENFSCMHVHTIARLPLRGVLQCWSWTGTRHRRPRSPGPGSIVARDQKMALHAV